MMSDRWRYAHNCSIHHYVNVSKFKGRRQAFFSKYLEGISFLWMTRQVDRMFNGNIRPYLLRIHRNDFLTEIFVPICVFSHEIQRFLSE